MRSLSIWRFYDSYSSPFWSLSFSRAEEEEKKKKEGESRNKRQSENTASFEVRGPSPASQRRMDLGSVDGIQGTHKFPETVWNICTVCLCMCLYVCMYTCTYVTISRLRVHNFYHLKIFMSSTLRIILK